MRTAIRDVFELVGRLGLPESLAHAAQAASQSFSLFVPEEFLARMEPGNPRDPLLLQILPAAEETAPRDDFTKDPVHEFGGDSGNGLIHKYANRALMVVHETCAAHCRYCFRRHFPYAVTGPAHWDQALQLVADDNTLEELILSGGDPLTLGDDRLEELIQKAGDIPQLKRLRIHTRLPILIPQRITREFTDLLRQSRLQAWLVIHANHPRELDAAVARSLSQIRDAGIPLLNQAVLLRGINDDAHVLRDLCVRLVDVGVVPYYLHQLDRVAGAAHFEVKVERGRELIQALRNSLPGYAVP
ncbi:MAG TPA: EF-P beta-lysylation protein EpmB, partial [Pirellulaceae bacterium]